MRKNRNDDRPIDMEDDPRSPDEIAALDTLAWAVVRYRQRWDPLETFAIADAAEALCREARSRRAQTQPGRDVPDIKESFT